MRISVWMIGILTVSGCAAKPGSLRVDVKSDLVPSVELRSVRLTELGSGFTQQLVVEPSQNWFEGVRVGEFMLPMGGLVELNVEALAAGDVVLVERRAAVQVDGNTAITVVLSRDCRGVECPGAGDSPSAIACLGARCVDPECLTGAEPECPEPACSTVVDCGAGLPDCASAACIDGVCLALDLGMCTDGAVCDPDEGCVNGTLPPNPIRSLAVTSASRDELDEVGGALVLAADVLVVAAPGDDSNATGVGGDEENDAASESGAALIYRQGVLPLIGATWLQDGFVKASNTDAGDAFGSSVAISADGSTVAVAAPFEASGTGDESDDSAPGAGAVYVFVRSGDAWAQQAYIKAPNADADDNFGVVALSDDGNTLAVGAPLEDSGNPSDPGDDAAPDAGAVYIFSRAGTTWSEDGYVKAGTPGAGDLFGSALALSPDGDRLVVGAPAEDGSSTGFDGDETDDGAMDSGAAYLFERSGPSWIQIAYIKASNTDPGDAFGSAIGLGGINAAFLAVGAPGEASSASLNGDQSNDDLSGAGAVYVFDLMTSVQDAYVKASNPGADDRFGHAVSLTATVPVDLLVGAPHESSNATRFDEDQENDDAPQAGAAYRFRGGLAGWRQLFYLKAFHGGAGALFGTSVHLTPDRAIIGAPGYTDDDDGMLQTGIFYTLDFTE